MHLYIQLPSDAETWPELEEVKGLGEGELAEAEPQQDC